MDLITGVLIAAIVLFGTGNAILIYTQPKAALKERVAADSVRLMTAQTVDETALAGASLIAVNQKIVFLNERLSRVEQILAQIPLDALQERFDVSELRTKVDRLMAFKRDVEIQVVALRDAAHQNGLLTPKADQIERIESELDDQQRELKELETEIRARAFNSHKPKK